MAWWSEGGDGNQVGGGWTKCGNDSGVFWSLKIGGGKHRSWCQMDLSFAIYYLHKLFLPR